MKDEVKFQNRYRIPSNRMSGWEYNAEGAYFLTICSYNRIHLFGKIVAGEMMLNDFGLIVKKEWEYSSCLRSEIVLGSYVVMPNHFHAIVHIVGDGDTATATNMTTANNNTAAATTVETHGRASLPSSPPTPPSLLPLSSSSSPLSRLPKSISSLMAGFKSVVTKQINLMRHTPGEKVWQSNYYDHIIRNEKEYQRITDYINKNPLCWQSDSLRR